MGKVVFGLYSPRKECHDRVTRKSGSFDRTVSAIRASRNADIEREIHFVPFKRNYTHLAGLATFARENGIGKVSVLRFVPQGRGVIFKNSHEVLLQKESLELRKLITECQRTHKVKIRLGSPYNILLLQKDVDCNAARRTLIVGPNGNIYPCDAFKNIEPADIGLADEYNNVLVQPIEACWRRSEYLNAIRRYLSTPFGRPCSACEYLEQCKSGCLAQKVIEQESIQHGEIAKKPDPLCLRAFIGGIHAPN
ncbi:MAG: SPASM domain-containing protein [Chloroflexi bacterium]|nr:SPASM domain-containing protein [Chloroflexota bacterium]